MASIAEHLDKANNAEPEEEASSRAMDPELRIMGKILRLLDDLQPPAKARAVAYIYSRYANP